MKSFFKLLTCFILIISLLTVIALAHPGRTDSYGGHNVRAAGWGYPVGTYHFHDRNGVIIPADESTGEVLGVTVIVKGESVFFDQPPVIIGDRTLVPVRYVAEKLGCDVEWEPITQTVYIKNTNIENIPFNGDGIEVVVNNELVTFDVPPTIIGDRTLIPIRAVVEKLGCTVEWEPTLRIVYID